MPKFDAKTRTLTIGAGESVGSISSDKFGFSVGNLETGKDDRFEFEGVSRATKARPRGRRTLSTRGAVGQTAAGKRKNRSLISDEALGNRKNTLG